jgi:hypothetical protein
VNWIAGAGSAENRTIVARTQILSFEENSCHPRFRTLLRRLPPLAGAPVRIEYVRGLHDRHGAAHAGSFLRQRSIAYNCNRAEFPRVLVHELFHFVWARLGNPVRRSFEGLLQAEWEAGAGGELGWSAEWRKRELRSSDVKLRSRRWREYCCESFCDTAAWLYSGVGRHEEFTLVTRSRSGRRAWFKAAIETRRLSI